MSKRIKSENVLKVINNFKKLPSKAFKREKLDMSKAGVSVLPSFCGTVHCHGGWYLVATSPIRLSKTYKEGAQKMMEDLGLGSLSGFARGPQIDPSIWGNSSSQYMFSSKLAFCHPTKRPYGASNLQDIVDHWTEVYERVKAMEEQEQRKNIVSELAILPIQETLDVKEASISITEGLETLGK